MPLIEHGNCCEHSKTIRYPCPIKNVRGYTLGTVSGCIENNPMYMSVHPWMDMDNELICYFNQKYPFTMSMKKHVSKNKKFVLSKTFFWETFVPECLFSSREYSLKLAIRRKGRRVYLSWSKIFYNLINNIHMDFSVLIYLWNNRLPYLIEKSQFGYHMGFILISQMQQHVSY